MAANVVPATGSARCWRRRSASGAGSSCSPARSTSRAPAWRPRPPEPAIGQKQRDVTRHARLRDVSTGRAW